MILDIPFQADLIMLQSMRQQKIDQRLISANARCISYDYQPGMNVYLLTARKSKLDPVYAGPYPIVLTHTNGTVTIQLSTNVRDRVNIRRIKPA